MTCLRLLRGHEVVAVYTDAGLSGALPAAERPGLAEALEGIESGRLDGLVVRDLDRLTRELTVQEAALAQIWTRPRTFVFEYGRDAEVLRDDPDDPMRTTIRQIMGAIKELDRKLVVKRLRDGRRAKSRRGQHANGPAPCGWRTEHGELVPVPSELDTIERMLALRSEGLRQSDIAEQLNTDGLHTRTSAAWTQPVVSRVLRREDALTEGQRDSRFARRGLEGGRTGSPD